MTYDPLKVKYWPTYMRIAEEAAASSTSQVAKVGAVLVLPTGMLSIGWNGTPPGTSNCCEDHTLTKIDELTGLTRHPTRADVIHAEINVFKKLQLQNISPSGGVLFTTLSPCERCCEYIQNTGIKTVVWKDTYKHPHGFDLLSAVGIQLCHFSHNHQGTPCLRFM